MGFTLKVPDGALSCYRHRSEVAWKLFDSAAIGGVLRALQSMHDVRTVVRVAGGGRRRGRCAHATAGWLAWIPPDLTPPRLGRARRRNTIVALS